MIKYMLVFDQPVTVPSLGLKLRYIGTFDNQTQAREWWSGHTSDTLAHIVPMFAVSNPNCKGHNALEELELAPADQVMAYLKSLGFKVSKGN